MPAIEKNPSSEDFLKSLGFPVLSVHDTFTHFDFTKPGRRVLLIGPMGFTFGLCLDSGPIFLFCLAAAVVGAVIARLHQRLRYLEEETKFLRQRLDRVEKQSDQL